MKGQAPELDTSRMIELLRRQRDLYRGLRELSEKQRTMISGDRPELLLSILRDRQDLVTSLARLNEELGPFRRNWDALYAGLPEPLRNEASGLLHEINTLLRTILQTDQEDSALLSARKQVIGAQITGVAGGQAANTAYGRPAGETPAGGADVTG